MKEAEIVSTEIFKQLFKSYLPAKVESLENFSPSDVSSDLSEFFKIYQSANSEQKSAIKYYLETIITDVASTILGGLDGCTDLGNLSWDFQVKYCSTDITGYLQDNFLEKVQTMYDEE